MGEVGTDGEASWIEGAPLDEPAVAEAVLDLWQRAARIAREPGGEAVLPGDVRSAAALLDEASDWIVAALEAGERTVAPRMLVDINRRQGDVREVATQWRGRALARVHAALARLRGVGSVDQLIDLALAELCRCGFDRVMLTRIDGSRAVPQAIHVAGDTGLGRELRELAATLDVELDHRTPETEMLRRPGPLLVPEARFDPRVHPRILEATGTRSYVAAPVMPQGKVIAFLHADCLVTRRILDESDRDLLWTFAQGFSYAWERVVLLERLRTLRQDVRRGNASVLAVMDEFCEADVEMAQFDPGNQTLVSSAAAMLVSADSRLDALLTRRELDVMQLMAVGETNSSIAAKLFVSEGTVKSHVKHILRKLRAKNRAEAVSRFITLTRREAPI
ncbi:MAG: LuxR family transcriptional regulator [Solirubrobacterales bacterium]|nr:LuxR family transcriptional regulator [Solirubrobacterales bacterium]